MRVEVTTLSTSNFCTALFLLTTNVHGKNFQDLTIFLAIFLKAVTQALSKRKANVQYATAKNLH